MAVALAPRIIVDPSIRFGKPVIEETRVPVDLIVAKVAGGTGLDDVAEEYGITTEDVKAALNYAAQLIAGEEIRAVAQMWRFLVDEDMPRSTGHCGDRAHSPSALSGCGPRPSNADRRTCSNSSAGRGPAGNQEMPRWPARWAGDNR